MTTFCLLHSSGQGPEGWRLVRQALEARGHRVVTPAFDVHATDQGAMWHTARIVEEIRKARCSPSDCICVAHSAGGIFLPVIAQAFKPQRMVFLAALIPRPGISILDQFRADRSMFEPAWVGKDPSDDAVAREFLYHDCAPDRAEWALSTRISFYAERAMNEACPLQSWPAIPAAYIVCADDRTVSPAWQRKAAREWLSVEPFELPGGHCPNVSRPEALASLLVDCTI